MVVSLGIEGRPGRIALGPRSTMAPSAGRVGPEDASAVVLSGDAESCRRLRGALALAGWHDHAAATCVDDLASLARRHHQLLVVDLSHPPFAADVDLRRAAATIARRPGTLLVTCGDEASAEHEAWARAHAAFCHLAGTVSGEALASVFEQARDVVERVSPSSSAAA